MKNPNPPMPSGAMTDAAAMPPGMPAMPAMPATPAEGGEVMMSIPKTTFDQLHGIVVQLAEAIDALAMSVEQQAMDSGAGAMPPMPPGEMAADADLAAFAEELSRGTM